MQLQNIIRYFLDYKTLASAIIGILGFWVGIDAFLTWYFTDLPSRVVAADLTYALMTFTVFGWATINHRKSKKHERYAMSAEAIHKAVHAIRDADTYVRSRSPASGSYPGEDYLSNCQTAFVEVMDRIRTVFNLTTGCLCRVALKICVTDGDEQKVMLFTLARNNTVYFTLLDKDQWRVRNKHDPLSKNPYLETIAANKYVFFSNDLMKKPFTSSSLRAYDKDAAATYVPSWDKRANRRNWPLPYRSLLATPISQGPFLLRKDYRIDIVGYLLVDCRQPGVFTRNDVELMFTFSDALYGSVRAYIMASEALQASKKNATGAAHAAPKMITGSDTS